jgi:hypothetical protein
MKIFVDLYKAKIDWPVQSLTSIYSNLTKIYVLQHIVDESSETQIDCNLEYGDESRNIVFLL